MGTSGTAYKWVWLSYLVKYGSNYTATFGEALFYCEISLSRKISYV